MWVELMLPVLGLLLYSKLAPDLQPIKGVYRQKGKWYFLKYVAFYLLLKLRSATKKSSHASDNETPGYGIKSKKSVDDMEECQPLPDRAEYPEAVDAVYFCASNSEGYYLVTATARRQGGMIQALTYLLLPDEGLFELPVHPETMHEETKPLSYASHGLNIYKVEPMKKWKIQFDGQLRHAKSGKFHNVKFDLEWIACTPYFDFDTDMNVWATCDSMAREVWTRQWFDTLKKRHQTHYEQFGKTTGKIAVEGFGEFDVNMCGVRDHSYGNIRHWADLFRYAIQYLHLQDGTCIAVGNICIPKLMSRLTIGFVATTDGAFNSVSWTNFKFEDWGDDGQPPNELQFDFKAGNKTYKLTCSVVATPQFFMRDVCKDGNWPCLAGGQVPDGAHGSVLYERLCKFTVNGIPGTGISEWCYDSPDVGYKIAVHYENKPFELSEDRVSIPLTYLDLVYNYFNDTVDSCNSI